MILNSPKKIEAGLGKRSLSEENWRKTLISPRPNKHTGGCPQSRLVTFKQTPVLLSVRVLAPTTKVYYHRHRHRGRHRSLRRQGVIKATPSGKSLQDHAKGRNRSADWPTPMTNRSPVKMTSCSLPVMVVPQHRTVPSHGPVPSPRFDVVALGSTVVMCRTRLSVRDCGVSPLKSGGWGRSSGRGIALMAVDVNDAMSVGDQKSASMAVCATHARSAGEHRSVSTVVYAATASSAAEH